MGHLPHRASPSLSLKNVLLSLKQKSTEEGGIDLNEQQTRLTINLVYLNLPPRARMLNKYILQYELKPSK